MGSFWKTNPISGGKMGVFTENEATFGPLAGSFAAKTTSRRLNQPVLRPSLGGGGTLNCAYQLTKRGLKIIGVPKTIDNDVRGTEVTFGFNTAVTTATEAVDKLHTTAASHHRVMLLEVMGRTAGWLALTSGLAGGAASGACADAAIRGDSPWLTTARASWT